MFQQARHRTDLIHVHVAAERAQQPGYRHLTFLFITKWCEVLSLNAHDTAQTLNNRRALILHPGVYLFFHMILQEIYFRAKDCLCWIYHNLMESHATYRNSGTGCACLAESWRK